MWLVEVGLKVDAHVPEAVDTSLPRIRPELFLHLRSGLHKGYNVLPCPVQDLLILGLLLRRPVILSSPVNAFFIEVRGEDSLSSGGRGL